MNNENWWRRLQLAWYQLFGWPRKIGIQLIAEELAKENKPITAATLVERYNYYAWKHGATEREGFIAVRDLPKQFRSGDQ